MKNRLFAICCLLVIMSLLTGCDMGQNTKNEQTKLQDSTYEIDGEGRNRAITDEENASENGIFRKQQNFAVNNINFTRHHVFIKQGQIEEHIYYTFFADRSKFAKLNEITTEFANIARLDSIKIAGKSPLEDEETSYESTQRIDSVYFINQDLITVEFNYQYMASGMECENKENKLVTYSIAKKDVIGLKDIFGAKTGQAQKIIGEKLQAKFLKEIDNYAENAYAKPAEESINAYKQKFANISFLKEAYMGVFKDSLAFSYTLGNECNLPPFVVGKVAIKDLADLLPKGSTYLKD
ncbi:hypothetical protein [Thermoflexibacter ruber]|uniref:DUF3298 domain-containing protein n=1 Tax=Thermoflexibacter ruber TaxID=1003 RepID=A0A1I2HVL3_9BACT|nr:hypothetical protein [Thermoflexibacter ruber]SFF32777.1 hypothetical protein SAMN04488541_102617 [Thermoflexibacter ruber]